MQRRARAVASWFLVGAVGVLGVLGPFEAPRSEGWFRGFWALYMVVGVTGVVTVLRARRLTVRHCLVAGGIGTITVAIIAPETPGLPLPSVVHSAFFATGLATMAAARLENRPQVGLAVTISVSLVFLGSALLANGALETALTGLLIGPVTAGFIFGAPLALAVSLGNSEVDDRPEYRFR